jgi:hypothetical protein
MVSLAITKQRERLLEKDSPVQSSQSLNRGSWNDCQSIRQKEILSGTTGKGNF